MKKSKNKKKSVSFTAAFAVSVIGLLIVFIIFVFTLKPQKRDENNSSSQQTSLISSEILSSEDSMTESKAESKAESEVKPVVNVSGLTLNKTELGIYEGYYTTLTATVLPNDAANKGVIWSSSDTSVMTVTNGKLAALREGSCLIKVTSKENPNIFAEAQVTVTKEIVENATYIDGILIANKTYPLPETFNPGVNAAAKAALDEMFAAAKNDGITLKVVSGFRSYSTQKTLYENYVKRDGQAAADRYSARAGHSEHQTGLAFDLNSTKDSFADTKEGKWIAQNAHKYGFIVRYPKDKEEITGYMYEPWHIRYLGKDIAPKVFDSGLCLEEYLGITSVYAE